MPDYAKEMAHCSSDVKSNLTGSVIEDNKSGIKLDARKILSGTGWFLRGKCWVYIIGVCIHPTIQMTKLL